MNHLLIAFSTDMLRGPGLLRRAILKLDPDELMRISSIYRRVEKSTKQTLSATVLAVVQLVSLKSLTEFRHEFEAILEPGLQIRLLAFNDQVYLDPAWPLPHPDLHLDPLVLRSAAEIHAQFKHPVLGKSLQELVKSTEASFGSTQFEFLLRGEKLLAETFSE